MLIAPLFCFMGEPLENNNHLRVYPGRSIRAVFNFPCISILDTPNIHIRKPAHSQYALKLWHIHIYRSLKKERMCCPYFLDAVFALGGLLLFLLSSSEYFLSLANLWLYFQRLGRFGFPLFCFQLIASQDCDICSSAWLQPKVFGCHIVCYQRI